MSLRAYKSLGLSVRLQTCKVGSCICSGPQEQGKIPQPFPYLSNSWIALNKGKTLSMLLCPTPNSVPPILHLELQRSSGISWQVHSAPSLWLSKSLRIPPSP